VVCLEIEVTRNSFNPYWQLLQDRLTGVVRLLVGWMLQLVWHWHRYLVGRPGHFITGLHHWHRLRQPPLRRLGSIRLLGFFMALDLLGSTMAWLVLLQLGLLTGCSTSSISPIRGWSIDWSRATLTQGICVVASSKSGPCAFGRLIGRVHNLVDNGLKPYGVWVDVTYGCSNGSHRFCCPEVFNMELKPSIV
jgi:hypothetical protein